MSTLTDIYCFPTDYALLCIALIILIVGTIFGIAISPYVLPTLSNFVARSLSFSIGASTTKSHISDTQADEIKPEADDPSATKRRARKNLPENPDAPIWASIFPSLQAPNNNPHNANAQVSRYHTIRALEEFKYNRTKNPMLRLRDIEVSADGSAILGPEPHGNAMWAAEYVVEKASGGRKKGGSAASTPERKRGGAGAEEGETDGKE